MPTEPKRPEFPSRIAVLCSRLNARAAGIWQVEGENLRQLAFDAAPDMPDELADRFAQATRLVPLDRTSLGIVRAALDRRRIVSIAADLNPEVGSGFWLREFRAARSVAVPITDRAGTVVAVVSVALSTLEPPTDEIEATLRSETTAWFSGP